MLIQSDGNFRKKIENTSTKEERIAERKRWVGNNIYFYSKFFCKYLKKIGNVITNS